MNPLIDLSRLEGVWESVSLNPAAIILRCYGGSYKLMILHVEVYTAQACPAVYDIEQDDEGYYIGVLSLGGQRLSYDPLSDTLTLSRLGDYMRN